MSPHHQSLRLVCPKHADILAKLGRRLPANCSLKVLKDPPVAAQLLDTETAALWHSDTLLLRADERLLALTGSQNHYLAIGQQPLAFIEDIEPGPLRAALGAVPALRSMRPRLAVTWKQSSAELLDENGANVLHIDVITLDSGHRRSHLIDIRPAGDHQNILHAITTELHQLGAMACAGIDRTDNDTNRSNPNAPGTMMHALLPAYSGTGYLSNPGVTLTPDMSVKVATTLMIRTYIGVARHNEAGIIADLDTEYLHDYRVSLRRVRSIISLFKGAYEPHQQQTLKARLSDLMRQTNRLRDLDVYLLEQRDDFNALPSALHPGLHEVFAAFAAERQAQWQRLAEQLNSRTYRMEMRSLQRTFAREERLEPGPAAHLNCRVQSAHLITRRYRKVCKIAATIDSETPDHRVHELRLQCKKLRYLLDLSAPLFNRKQVKKIIKSLKRLQDNLGRFNDYSVQQIALQHFLDQQLHQDPNTSPQMVEAVGALIAVKHQLQSNERSLVMQHFADFHVPETDALFDAAFGEHDA